jgi:exonuclease III
MRARAGLTGQRDWYRLILAAQSRPDTGAERMHFRFMTFNILDGGAEREQMILEVLRAQRTDAVILQEVKHRAIVEDFGKALGMHTYLARGNSRRHLALLSRFPIVSHHNYHPFPLRNGLLETTVEITPDQRVHLFGVHLLAHYFFLCEWWRVWEIDTILQRVSGNRPDPRILAGDFNAVAPGSRIDIHALPTRLKAMLLFQAGHIFSTAVAKMFTAGFVDCYRAAHSRADGFTLPTPDPHARLDYVFADRSLARRLRRCDVVTEPSAVHGASDHYPVLAEFEL